MNALSKTLFFTTGSVGLLVLVFLWSALKYGLFKLNFLSETILNYKFAGISLTDFLLISSSNDPGIRIYLLKLFITGFIGIGSLILIVLSYLPRLSWQLRSLSLIVSITLFTLLTLFWVCLKNGSEVIRTSEKSVIFSFTAITYLLGVFLLWYAMRAKSRKHSKITTQRSKSSAPSTQAKTLSQKENDSTEETSADEKSLEVAADSDQEKEASSPDSSNNEQSTNLNEKDLPAEEPSHVTSQDEEKTEMQNETEISDTEEENDAMDVVEGAEIAAIQEGDNLGLSQTESDEGSTHEEENSEDEKSEGSSSTDQVKVA